VISGRVPCEKRALYTSFYTHFYLFLPFCVSWDFVDKFVLALNYFYVRELQDIWRIETEVWLFHLHIVCTRISTMKSANVGVTWYLHSPYDHIWDVMLVWRKGNIETNSLCYSNACYYNGAQRYEQFLQVSRLYRALILFG